VSFWVYSSLTGTFSAAIKNSGDDYSYLFNYTISSASTWTYITQTIPGPTAGTWIGATNGIGVKINFNLGTGSSYSGTAGSWVAQAYYATTGSVSVVGTNNATWYVTGVQIESGTTATNFDFRSYQTELNLCYRYYWKKYFISAFPGFTDSTSNSLNIADFPVEMRTTPTMSTTGTAGNYSVRYAATSANCNAVPTFDSGTSFSGRVIASAASLSSGQSCYLVTSSGGYFLAWSAEL
jgi:hypothetical protein